MNEMKLKLFPSYYRDKIFKDLVQKHAAGLLTLDEYFDEVVKNNISRGELDLPKKMQEELLAES